LKIESFVSDLLLVLALVSLMISLVTIANTTLLSVVRRTGEIGLRRSLGATPRHIALLIVVEAAIVAWCLNADVFSRDLGLHCDADVFRVGLRASMRGERTSAPSMSG
jgi:hypothetical protein